MAPSCRRSGQYIFAEIVRSSAVLLVFTSLSQSATLVASLENSVPELQSYAQLGTDEKISGLANTISQAQVNDAGKLLQAKAGPRLKLLQVDTGLSGKCSALRTSTGAVATFATDSMCARSPDGAVQKYTACCTPTCLTSSPGCFCVGYTDPYLSCTARTTNNSPRTIPGCCSQPAGGFDGASLEYTPVLALQGKADSKYCKANFLGKQYGGCCSAECGTQDNERCFCVGYGSSIVDSKYDCTLTALPVAGCCSSRTANYAPGTSMAIAPLAATTSTNSPLVYPPPVISPVTSPPSLQIAGAPLASQPTAPPPAAAVTVLPTPTSATPTPTSATPNVTSATPIVPSATPIVTSATPIVTSAMQTPAAATAPALSSGAQLPVTQAAAGPTTPQVSAAPGRGMRTAAAWTLNLVATSVVLLVVPALI